MISGQGKLIIKKRGKNLYQYDGNFVENKKDGYGEMTYSDEKSYKGHFKNDKKHGTGSLVTDSQTNYTGEWKLGKMHGQGTLISKGVVKTGSWNMGEFINKKWGDK